jgi:hypothetical protein
MDSCNAWAQWTVARWSHKQWNPILIYVCCIRHVFLMFKHWFCWNRKKRVLLRKYQLIQLTYISNIGLYHAMYSLYMFMRCSNRTQCVLCMGTMGSCWGSHEQRNAILIYKVCMLYTAWILMFKHWFCWNYQYKKYMFNLIDHLQFYFCECVFRLILC